MLVWDANYTLLKALAGTNDEETNDLGHGRGLSSEIMKTKTNEISGGLEHFSKNSRLPNNGSLFTEENYNNTHAGDMCFL